MVIQLMDLHRCGMFENVTEARRGDAFVCQLSDANPLRSSCILANSGTLHTRLDTWAPNLLSEDLWLSVGS